MVEKNKLLVKVGHDILLARKSKSGIKVTALGMLKAKLLENSKSLTPRDEDLVVKGYMKQLNESLAAYKTQPKYADKLQSLEEEISVIAEYMPAELAEEDIVRVVKDVIAGLPEGARKMGTIMGKAMKVIKGMEGGKTIDGAIIKRIVDGLV